MSRHLLRGIGPHGALKKGDSAEVPHGDADEPSSIERQGAKPAGLVQGKSARLAEELRKIRSLDEPVPEPRALASAQVKGARPPPPRGPALGATLVGIPMTFVSGELKSRSPSLAASALVEEAGGGSSTRTSLASPGQPPPSAVEPSSASSGTSALVLHNRAGILQTMTEPEEEGVDARGSSEVVAMSDEPGFGGHLPWYEQTARPGRIDDRRATGKARASTAGTSTANRRRVAIGIGIGLILAVAGFALFRLGIPGTPPLEPAGPVREAAAQSSGVSAAAPATRARVLEVAPPQAEQTAPSSSPPKTVDAPATGASTTSLSPEPSSPAPAPAPRAGLGQPGRSEGRENAPYRKAEKLRGPGRPPSPVTGMTTARSSGASSSPATTTSRNSSSLVPAQPGVSDTAGPPRASAPASVSAPGSPVPPAAPSPAAEAASAKTAPGKARGRGDDPDSTLPLDLN